MKNRVKKVKKENHEHPLKTDMKTIFAKQPLIVRKEWKVPTYPKVRFSSIIRDLELRSHTTSSLTVTAPKKDVLSDSDK